jgi:hypothetical protein
VHVTVIDLPAFFAGVSRSAAGEGEHTLLKRGPRHSAILL